MQTLRLLSKSTGAYVMANAIDTLQNLQKDLSSKAKVYTAGAMAESFIRSHINTGLGMSPLSAATTSYRGQGKPLEDTGNLRDSITYQVINASTATVGTTRKDAALHNKGGTITAKKNWLFIPAAGTRKLERTYGKKPGDVLSGLRSNGASVFRIGRTVCYSSPDTQGKPKVVYYLKKSVIIPKREFFYLSDYEVKLIMQEIAPKI